MTLTITLNATIGEGDVVAFEALVDDVLDGGEVQDVVHDAARLAGLDARITSASCRVDDVLRTIARDPREWRHGVNRALVARFFGRTTVLVWCGAAIEHEVSCVGDGADLAESLGVVGDGDGLYVWEGDYVDDGPGDWPGSRECRLDGWWRRATDEEWARHGRDEWPWDDVHEEHVQPPTTTPCALAPGARHPHREP